MNTLPMPGGFERFSERSDVRRVKDQIAMATEALNDTLSFTSSNYDGVISFGHEPGEALALPLADANAYNVAPDRYKFRTDNIIGRRLLISKTALEVALKPKEPILFAESAINPSGQFVYTHPLLHDGHTVGALQYSFTPESPQKSIDNFPENDEMEAIHIQHRPEIDEIATQTARLQKLAHETKGTKSLATGLEMEQPVAPNAYVIRWDIRGSSHFVNSDLGPVYDAFVGQVHAHLHELTLGYPKKYEYLKAGVHEAYDDQGDGAYIVLPFPSYVNPYDRRALDDFERDHVKAFMQEIHAGIEAISRQYRTTFNPKVVITADSGYVEKNTIGRFESRAMHALANRQKEK